MPISNTYLRRYAMSFDAYKKGIEYKIGGKVSITRNVLKGDVRHLESDVKGSGGNLYHVEVTINEETDRIIEQFCGCEAFYSYDGACKHIIATVLAHNDMNSNTDTTDPTVISLINKYAQRTVAAALVSDTAKPAKIEPTIRIDYYSDVRLTFKIGENRLYVIKDLSSFKRSMINNETVEYGKQFTFVHDINNIDEQSRALTKFILSHSAEEELSYSSSYYHNNTVNDHKKSISLSSFTFDDFFEAYPLNKIKLEDENGVFTADIVRSNPSLTVNVDKQKNGSYKLSLADNVQFLGSSDFCYIVKNSSIYCCDKEFSQNTSDLLKALSRQKKLIVSAKDINVMFSSVLQQIKPYVTILSDSDISTFEPLPLVSKLYLDMPYADYITARLEFCYGFDKHEAFKQKTLSQSADLAGEIFAENMVQKYLSGFNAKDNYRYIDENEDEIFKLKSQGLPEFTDLMEIYATDKFKSMKIKPPVAISVGVRVQSELLKLSFDIGDIDISDLISVLHSYKQAKKYHRLKDGSFIDLENSSLSEFSELAEGLNLSDKEISKGELSIPKYRALYLDTIIKQSNQMNYDRDSGFKKIIRDIKDFSDSDYEVPVQLKKTLRGYQKTGYRWLKTLGSYGFGGILADDMGLGKTLQVITLLLSIKTDDTPQLSIVICPSSLVLNWESEIAKFAPELITQTVTGTTAEREEILKSTGNIDVLITSYDLLKRDIERYEGFQFYYEIIDEAQYIKNHNTQNAKAVKLINSVNHLALTGTPVENSLAELWSIYDFLMPNYLYNYHQFKQRFESPIVKDRDVNALDGLKKLVQPFILRRLKRDVLKELPEKTETVMYAKLEGEQKKLYLANIASMKKELAQQFEGEGFEKSKFLVLAMLTKLRQLCCDPSLLYEGYNDSSAKLDMCMELIQNCIDSGHKLLLFSQFTSMLKIIEDKLNINGTKFYKITGSTKPDQRLGLVNDFNADDTPVFLISLKAGGTGLNLTGADVVIHFDPWWNLSAQTQATDRAHRIGQKNSVQVYKLIAKDTIEEKILKMQQDKAELADLVIKDGDAAIFNMSKDDLVGLFE